MLHSPGWWRPFAIKYGAFVLLERRLPWRTAILYMLVANIMSIIPGALIGGFTASLSGVILAVPLVFVLGCVVQRRLALLPQPGLSPPGSMIARAVV